MSDPTHPELTPSGTVEFLDSDGRRHTVTLDAAGKASFTVEFGGDRVVNVLATYCPDADAFVASSGELTQTITQDATTIDVSATPSPSLVGQPVTFTAKVTNLDAPDKTPTGNVRFEVDGSVFTATVPLEDGEASTQTSSLPYGGHLVAAIYQPDDAFFAAVSTNTPQTTTRSQSGVTLSVAPDPTVAGQPSVFEIAVSGTSFDGSKPSGSVQLWEDNGPPSATRCRSTRPARHRWSTTAGAGSYRVRAEYVGDARFNPGEAQVSQTIGRARTSTTLTTSAAVVRPGGTFILVAEVVADAPSEWVPDGEVDFSVDGVELDMPVPLDPDGFAAVEIQAPSRPATGTFRADYLGNQDFTPSGGSVLETVTAGEAAQTGGTAHPPAAAARIGASIVPGQALRSVLAKGLKTRVSCTAPCRFAHRLSVSRGTARKLRVGRVIGKGSGRLAEAGERTTTVKVSRRAARRLRRARTLRLALVTTIRQAGKRTVIRKRIILRRTGGSTSGLRSQRTATSRSRRAP